MTTIQMGTWGIAGAERRPSPPKATGTNARGQQIPLARTGLGHIPANKEAMRQCAGCTVSFPPKGKKKYCCDACKKDHWQINKRLGSKNVNKTRRTKRRNERLGRTMGRGGASTAGVPRVGMLTLPTASVPEVIGFIQAETGRYAKDRKTEREANRKRASEAKARKTATIKSTRRHARRGWLKLDDAITLESLARTGIFAYCQFNLSA